MRQRMTLGLLALAVTSCESPARRSDTPETVQLIVLVSVDQLPNYLLQRYDTLLSGGFRRLLDQGRYYGEAVHAHALTWTSPGHATLATGVHPARHGIVANYWFELHQSRWVKVSSVSDVDAPLLDVPDDPGASPRNLQVEGLPDWITAADSGARIASIAGKATAAIPLAGRTRGHVYWFARHIGRFVTSTYYRERYPRWVERYNQETLPEYMDSVWESRVPPPLRWASRSDSAQYENDGAHLFPHRYRSEIEPAAVDDPRRFFDWWRRTPMLDDATLALAREAVTRLALGGRGSVDYLAVGLAGLDRVGHRYGPLSQEQLDAVLRLDRALGDFLDFLDAHVGQNRYVLGLSSDHGVMPMPEQLWEVGELGRRVTRDEVEEAQRRAIRAAAAAVSPQEQLAFVVETLEDVDFIADVMTIDELAGPESPDSFVALYQRSYHPGRIPARGSGAFGAGWWVSNWRDRTGGTRIFPGREGLVLRFAEYTIAQSSDLTTHGSPYQYDRRVPIILFGAGVAGGRPAGEARTVDFAPTLALLAGISHPEGLDGRALDVRPITDPTQ